MKAQCTHTIKGPKKGRIYICSDRVAVSGMNHQITLSGMCGQVSVSGIDNYIFLDTAEVIRVSGQKNKVLYRYGSPRISKSGMDNVVEKKTTQ